MEEKSPCCFLIDIAKLFGKPITDYCWLLVTAMAAIWIKFIPTSAIRNSLLNLRL